VRVLAVGNLYPPHHLGGYELVWRSCARHLRASGHEVRILTSDHLEPGAGGAEDADVHRELRMYWRRYDFPRLGASERLRLELHNARVLDRHLAEYEPTVVNWWAMGGMSLSLVERVRRSGIGAVGVLCDEWLAYGPKVDGWIRAWARRPRLASIAERMTGVPTRVHFDGAASWITPSHMLLRNARARGLELPRAQVVPQGIDRRPFPMAPPRGWRGRLLYVGRIDPRKGIDTAIKALALLPLETTLTVVGSGDERHLAALEDLVKALGLEARVAFVPAVAQEELAAWYADADALLFPVRWDEPWGLVPLEAMSVGRPVIATGTGGSGEYLRHAHNCLLFDRRGGARSLAAAVRRLEDDPGLVARLRMGGLSTVDEIGEDAFNEAVRVALEAASGPGSPAGPRGPIRLGRFGR
jgi:glycogen(starch) synthase